MEAMIVQRLSEKCRMGRGTKLIMLFKVLKMLGFAGALPNLRKRKSPFSDSLLVL